MSEPKHKYPFLRWLGNVFISGLFTFLPISATIICFYWIVQFSEGLVGHWLQAYLPDEIYRPGLGIIAILVAVFVMGLLTKLWFVSGLMRFASSMLERIPIVKTVYSSIRDVIEFLFAPKDKGGAGRMVVMATLPGGWKQLGIVTRVDFEDLSSPLRREIVHSSDPNVPAKPESAYVAVYFPFSYQLGGYTYFVEAGQLREIEGMTVEDAMRYSVMAWMSGKGPKEAPNAVSAPEAAPALPPVAETQAEPPETGWESEEP